MSNQIYNNSTPTNRRYIDQRVTDIEAIVIPGIGAANKVAFYDSVGNLNDAQISVSGTENSLVFENNTQIKVDNITSTDGDLNLGYGLTNSLNLNSSATMGLTAVTTVINATTLTLDANTMTLGHAGITLGLQENIATNNILASKIDNGTSDLFLGTTTTSNTRIGRSSKDVVITNGARLFANYMDNTSTINIGIIAAPAVEIGRPAISTTVYNLITNQISNLVLIGIQAPTITIGESSSNVNIYPTAKLMAADVDSSTPASLYINTPFVTFGMVSGTVQMNCPINFTASGAEGINAYYLDKQFSINGSGAFASQQFLKWSFSRISNIVTAILMKTTVGITATANSIVTLDTMINSEYRPTDDLLFGCQLYTNGVAVPGTIGISTGGVVTLFPVGGWLIGQSININAISVSYDIAL